MCKRKRFANLKRSHENATAETQKVGSHATDNPKTKKGTLKIYCVKLDWKGVGEIRYIK